eukprot:6519934-Pyramimonas_sp.AAC.1
MARVGLLRRVRGSGPFRTASENCEFYEPGTIGGKPPARPRGLRGPMSAQGAHRWDGKVGSKPWRPLVVQPVGKEADTAEPRSLRLEA